MKEYYLERLHWIFNYTSNNFFYCLFKTLCLIVGIPLYAVMFLVEMVLTFVNMILGWIPIFGMVVTVICKSIVWVTEKSFFICILPDIKTYKKAIKDIQYDISDADEQLKATDSEATDLEE